jgi:hypothetical protein
MNIDPIGKETRRRPFPPPTVVVAGRNLPSRIEQLIKKVAVVVKRIEFIAIFL